MLETAPSLSIYSNNTGEGEEEREINSGSGDEDPNLVRSMTIGSKIDGTVSGEFCFSKPNMDLISEEEGGEVAEVIGVLEKLGKVEEQDGVDPASPPMYLAAGLGVVDGVGAEGFKLEREDSEEYCRELLEEYPNHPLILRNYANLLQSKGDLQGAEYYYFRAIQVDPGYGEILSRYAQVLWELYHDREKALTYFARAVQTAPEDSGHPVDVPNLANMLIDDLIFQQCSAAYAKFLWEIEDDGGEDPPLPDNFQQGIQEFIHFVSHSVDEMQHGGPNNVVDVENYCKRMIEDNPSDPLLLKTYAQFLYQVQSKGDLQGAEECYSKAILSDPEGGKVLSQYAKLIWELYHDKDRAASCFEKAIEAAPGDSDVLAAYASFLWAIDDDEVDEKIESLNESAGA